MSLDRLTFESMIRPRLQTSVALLLLSCSGGGSDSTITGPPPPVPVASVSITTSSASVQKGQTLQLTVETKDASGNSLPGRTVSWSSSSEAIATVTQSGVVSGLAVGSVTVTALSEGKSASTAIQVTPVPPTKLAFFNAPNAQTVNRIALTDQPIIQLQSAGGEPVGLEGVVVSASITAGGGTVTGSTATTTGTGTAKFTNLTLVGALGVKTLTFSATGLTPISANVTVNAGPPSSAIAIAGDNQSAKYGSVLPIPPTLKVMDIDGNPLSGVAVTFSLANGGSVAVPNAVTGPDGVASAGSWTLGPSVGTNTLVASVAGLAMAVNFTANGVASTAGATKLVLMQAPSTVAAIRTPFAVQPVVQIQNSNGEPVSDSGTVVTVSVASAVVALSGTTSAASNKNGTITFTNLAISGRAGLTTLVFSATGLATVSAPVTTTPGPAARLVINFGNNQSAKVETAVASPSAKVTDADENDVQGVSVSFAVTSGGGSVGPSPQITNSSGNAFTTWTLGQLSGTNTMVATSAGLAGSPLTFTATAIARTYSGVFAGGDRTCATTQSAGGDVRPTYCWGASVGQPLGDGAEIDRSTPTLIQNGAMPATYSANFSVGYFHTCAGGYCWGSNTYGQIGDGTRTDRLAPTGITSFAAVAGGYHTCYSRANSLTRVGQTYCWGRNNRGQLGDGTQIDRLSEVPLGSEYTRLTLGLNHTCGFTGTTATCWGANESGQIGDGTTVDRATPTALATSVAFAKLAAGVDHTCGITFDDKAYCWGENSKGQLGTGTLISSSVPVPVAGALKIRSIYPGQFFTCAATLTEEVYCWGVNTFGQLGDGTTINHSTPAQVLGVVGGSMDVGSNHVCAGGSNGGLYCWGFNDRGQLGDNTKTNRSVPTPVR